MQDHGLDDGVVRLREWADDDAAWYAESVRDPLIQRFTTDSSTLDAGQVLAAIVRLRGAGDAEGFVICDAVTGQRLGNIALRHDGRVGEVSYWVAAGARGRGVATRALVLFSSWSFQTVGLHELWLRVHRENTASKRTALRAGYQRDPGRDKSQEVKGAVWPMLGYALRRPHGPVPHSDKLAAGGFGRGAAYGPFRELPLALIPGSSGSASQSSRVISGASAAGAGRIRAGTGAAEVFDSLRAVTLVRYLWPETAYGSL